MSKNLYQFPLEYVQTPYGPCVYLPQDEYVGRSLHEYGYYSPSEVRLLTNILAQDCRSFWNVGSNIGYLAMAMAATHPDMSVYAVEAQPVMAELTRMNTARFPNARVRNIALGAEKGTVTIPPLDYAFTNNYGAVSRTEWTSGTPVELTTLDSLAILHLDLLQLDVEGMELDVLRGAKEHLEFQKPTLFLECDRPTEGAELLRALDEEFSYDTYWAVTPLYEEDNPACNPTNVFGACAAFNVVGVPRTREARPGEVWVRETLRRARATDEIGRTDRWLVLR